MTNCSYFFQCHEKPYQAGSTAGRGGDLCCVLSKGCQKEAGREVLQQICIISGEAGAEEQLDGHEINTILYLSLCKSAFGTFFIGGQWAVRWLSSNHRIFKLLICEPTVQSDSPESGSSPVVIMSLVWSKLAHSPRSSIIYPFE